MRIVLLYFLCWFSVANILAQDRPIVVASERANLLIAGMDNPIQIAAADGIIVSVTNGIIRASGNEYNWVPASAGMANLYITHPSGEKETFLFRIKLIPDPVAQLGICNKSCVMGAGEFKVHIMNGIIANILCCDMDARCETVSYEMTVVKKDKTVLKVKNIGRSPNEKAADIVEHIASGDTVYIERIKALCPTYLAPHTINSIFCEIK